MSRELLRRMAQDVGLKDGVDVILAAAADSIRLVPEPTEEHRLTLGASRLGGVPDMGPGQSWPMWQKGPLAFVAQIDLAALASFPVAEGLPNVGWLSFFYNAEQDTWGFDPKDAGSFRVVYTPAGPLTRVEPPRDLPSHGRFRLCGLTMLADVTLPSPESPAYTQSGMATLPIPQLDELLDRLTGEHDWGLRTMLFGYPDEIQGDMQVECAMVTGGLYCGDSTGYQDARAETLKASAQDWTLLLQVASHDAADMMWGDLGCLYYWLRRQDVATRAFDRTWLILQCS